MKILRPADAYWCMLLHSDACWCILIHTDACMLMHADEYWCIRCVGDVFLEHRLHILYVGVHADCMQSVYRRCTDSEQVVYCIHILFRFYTDSRLIVYRFYTDCVPLLHAAACWRMLMHADEYWCIKYVDDVFLEPHLHILLCGSIQNVYRL